MEGLERVLEYGGALYQGLNYLILLSKRSGVTTGGDSSLTFFLYWIGSECKLLIL